MGWRHFLAASSWSCPWSSPREGGAAKSGPMTLNRKCAQRSWDREVDDVSFIGCRYFHFSHPFGGAVRVYTSLPAAVARHPVRGKEPPSNRPFQRNRTGGNRRQEFEQLQQPIPPLVHREDSTQATGAKFSDRCGGKNRARAAFQKELCTKVCSHHSRQRSTVRRDPRPSSRAPPSAVAA